MGYIKPAKSNKDHSTKRGGECNYGPMMEPEANTHEQGTGRRRTTTPPGMGTSTGRRRTRGYPQARRP